MIQGCYGVERGEIMLPGERFHILSSRLQRARLM
jgi:hypothetical protein